MALNAKQQQFVNEYLQCFNATRSALAAGYSGKTAHAIGWENLRKPEIAEAIRRRLQETAMSADEVMTRLADQGRGDLGEFLVRDGDSITVDLDAMRAERKTHLIKKITQIRRRRTIKDNTEDEITTSLELYDAQAALVHIGRHHKLFTDKSEVAGDVTFRDSESALERINSRIAGITARLGTPTPIDGNRTDGEGTEGA